MYTSLWEAVCSLQKEHIKTKGVGIRSFVLTRSHAHDLSISAASESVFDLEKFFFFSLSFF